MTHPRPHAPARPHAYGVVGAGRVGSVVAARLHAAGRPVVGISARSQASLLRARTLVPEVIGFAAVLSNLSLSLIHI